MHRLLPIVLILLSVFPASQLALATDTPSFADPGFGKAQDIRPEDVIHWSPFQAASDALGISVSVRMTASDEWSIYAKNLSFSGPAGYTISKVDVPPALRQKDPMSDEEVDVYTGGEFTISLAGPSDWPEANFPITVRYVGCTKVICLFPHTQTLNVPFVASSPAPQQTSSLTLPTPIPASPEPSKISAFPCTSGSVAASGENSLDFESRLAKMLGANNVSFGLLLLLVFVGGLLSNLTPCVYPMIPITLRLLSRQGQSPLRSSIAYSLGIIVMYSALALMAAASGGLFGKLLASTAFNLIFAAIMALLGVTMLGFGDFSRLQALGSRLGTGNPSLRNTFLMGTGAGLVAAPCTGPILAALLAYTARGEHSLGPSTLLMVTYSVGFALPYVLLGGAAARVSAIRVPAAIQIGIKILFASVMLSLALYYLRIPFYSLVIKMRGHWQLLAAIFSSLGFGLLLIWTIDSRLANRKLSLLIPTTMLAIGIFASSQWATSTDHETTSQTGNKAFWYKNEAEAFAAAKSSGRPILIDMWAEWCEACKKMDATTFSDAKVIDVLSKHWTLLKLDLTESDPASEAIQKKYELTSLPTLVLLPPTGDLSQKQLILGYVNSSTLLSHLSQFCNAPTE